MLEYAPAPIWSISDPNTGLKSLVLAETSIPEMLSLAFWASKPFQLLPIVVLLTGIGLLSLEFVLCPLMESATLDMMVEFSLPPVES